MECRRLEAELGQEHFCPSEGEIIVIIITNNSPILGRAISINIFNSTISSQTLVLILCSIFVLEPHIGTYG